MVLNPASAPWWPEAVAAAAAGASVEDLAERFPASVEAIAEALSQESGDGLVAELVAEARASTSSAEERGFTRDELSDGQDWRMETIGSEICGLLRASVVAAIEAGKRLLWVQLNLGDRQAFDGWCTKNVPIGRISRHNLMRLGAFAAKHPKVTKALVSGGITKGRLLEVTQLPEEDLELLVDPQLPASQELEEELLSGVSLAGLAKQRDLAQAQAQKESEQAELLRRELEKAKIALGESRLVPDDDTRRRLERLRSAWSDLRSKLNQLGAMLDELGEEHQAGTLHPDLRREVQFVTQGVVVVAENERLRFEKLYGDELFADEALLRNYRRSDTLPAGVGVAPARRLQVVGDDGGGA